MSDNNRQVQDTIIYNSGGNAIFSTKGTDNIVRTIRFVTIELKHTGDQEIKQDDYQRPITFSFPKKSYIAKAYIIGTNTVADISKSELKIGYSGNVAILNKALLNPGDKYDIVFCVNQDSANSSESPFEIDARIVGMRDSGLIVYNINGKYTHPETVC